MFTLNNVLVVVALWIVVALGIIVAPRVWRAADARLRRRYGGDAERDGYERLVEGERAARVSLERDLAGVRAQRDEAMESAHAWECRANRLKAESTAKKKRPRRARRK